MVEVVVVVVAAAAKVVVTVVVRELGSSKATDQVARSQTEWQGHRPSGKARSQTE